MSIRSTRTARCPAPSLIVATAAAALLTGCEKQSETAATQPPPRVTVAPVTSGPVPIIMQLSGTVKAVRIVEVIPHVSGYIGERYFVEGSRVEAGDPLYRIDPRPFEATLAKYVAELARNQANLDYSTREVTRFGRAVKTGAVSQEQYDQATAQQQEAQAAVDASRAQIDSARLDLDYTDIKAPFDGRTQQTRQYVGDLVAEYQDVLTTLVQMDPVHVIFNVSRRDLYHVREMELDGTIAPIRDHARVELLLPDASVYTERGRLDFVSAQIDPTTDTVTLRAVIANTLVENREALVPGQYVPVRLVLGERADALLIPRKAVVESQAGHNVFVVDANGKVESRKVTVGSPYKELRVIEDGLSKGEKVIVEGLQKVRAGTVVDPRPAS